MYQNFEIAILFNIVENHNDNVFGLRLTPPKFPGEGLQVKKFDQCLHMVMVIEKCTDVFQGGLFWFEGGGGLNRRIFSWRNMS